MLLNKKIKACHNVHLLGAPNSDHEFLSMLAFSIAKGDLLGRQQHVALTLTPVGEHSMQDFHELAIDLQDSSFSLLTNIAVTPIQALHQSRAHTTILVSGEHDSFDAIQLFHLQRTLQASELNTLHVSGLRRETLC